MRARFRSWWQKRSKPLTVVAITIVVVGGLAFILFAYLLRLAWTGFNSGTSQITITSASKGNYIATVSQPGKSLWDWLQLLIVSLALAIIALVFQRANNRTERQIAKDRYDQDREIAKQRYEQDQQIALDKQREDLLQVYLDRMSELLLKEQLRSSAVDAEVRNVARVRTITLLFQLDARRIGYVFAFLREAGLMSTTPNDSIVSLKNAKLEKINLSQADLYKANLYGADLYGANFSETNLSEANLSETNLSEANLSEANLSEANLYGAHLIGADLTGADLTGADLTGADLTGADLTGANLSGANLSGANLLGANFIGANLFGADLSEAFLYGANLIGANLSEADLSEANLYEANLSSAVATEEQLKEAYSLEHAIMPDGSIHP